MAQSPAELLPVPTEYTIATASCKEKRQQLDRLPDGSGRYLSYSTGGELLANVEIHRSVFDRWLKRFHVILHRREWTVWLKEPAR